MMNQIWNLLILPKKSEALATDFIKLYCNFKFKCTVMTYLVLKDKKQLYVIK